MSNEKATPTAVCQPGELVTRLTNSRVREHISLTEMTSYVPYVLQVHPHYIALRFYRHETSLHDQKLLISEERRQVAFSAPNFSTETRCIIHNIVDRGTK